MAASAGEKYYIYVAGGAVCADSARPQSYIFLGDASILRACVEVIRMLEIIVIARA